MKHSDAYVPVLTPSRRLGMAPNAVQPGNQALYNGWGPRPTGYYPDMNGETMGYIQTPLDNQVTSPYGSPGEPAVIPNQPGSDHDKVDQHPFLHVAATWTPGPSWDNGRPDGGHDPLTDGPPRPEIKNLSLHYHRESGASRTSYSDVPDGRRFLPYGSQDGSSTTVYVDSRAAMEPYNPDPATGQHRDSLMRLAPGPAHGWSSVPVVDTRVQDSDKRKVLKQQKNVGQNRLASSTYAGQTYSQQTAHVANPAGAPQNVPSWGRRV
jgi:hypothetical protein